MPARRALVGLAFTAVLTAAGFIAGCRAGSDARRLPRLLRRSSRSERASRGLREQGRSRSAYDGPVGESTGFSGGFVLAGDGVARCVTVEVRVKGSSRIYRRAVSFGAGPCS